jgi:hypothetical protein
MKGLKLLFFFFLSTNLFAQTIVKVENITGRYILSNDITPKQAKEFAFQDAKKNTLIKAGIPETIVSKSFFLQSESNNKISEIFKQFVSSEISGAITKIYDKRVVEKKDAFGNTVFEVVITADVIKYETSIDPTFVFSIVGIDKIYKVNDRINFSCKSFADGYLHIFQLNDSLSTLVFPNMYEKENFMLKDRTIKFPRINGIAYTLDQIEENNLVFVFTKKNIPFNNSESIDGIIEWIYKIAPNERQLQFFNVIVK